MAIKSVTDENGGNLEPGDILLYTIVFNNQSGFDVSGLEFVDAMPSNASYVTDSATAPAGSTIVSEEPTLRIQDIGVPAHGDSTVTFRVRVDDPLPTGVTRISNQGTVNYDSDGDGVNDASQNTDGDTTEPGEQPTVIPVTAGPNFGEATKGWEMIEDADEDGFATPGDTLEYAVTIPNTGTRDAVGVTFTDEIPVNVAFVIGSETASSGAIVHDQDLNRIDWIGDIAAGEAVALTFEVTVNAGIPVGTTLSNQGVVGYDSDDDGVNDATEPTDGDTTEPGNQPTETTTGKPYGIALKNVADLNGGKVEPGDVLQYEITLDNRSGFVVTGMEFVDGIPANTRYVAGSVEAPAGASVEDESPVLRIVDIAVGARSRETIRFQVRVDDPLPSGVTQIANQATVRYDSDGDGVNDSAQNTDGDIGQPGEQPTVVPVFQGASLSGIVFNDANGNGVRDPGEAGIGNVVVMLLDGNGDPVAETATYETGAYSFGGLTPGAYTVIETDPEGFFSITNNTIGATLPLGGNAVVDFADIESGGVVGAVFEDLNGDGVQGPGEAGISGVLVDLVDADGEIVQSVETNEDGSYGFSNVEPGGYTVYETDPAGYASTTLNTVPVNLAAGGAATADFGDIEAGTISGVVFNDIDGNGVQDPEESGVGGATVELVEAGGNVIATAETDENGNYTFPDVLPGNYTVRETDPDGFGSATGNDRPVNVPSGGSAVANFGDGETGTISGAVFNDINGNGVKDAGETGLAGVRVELVDADGTVVGAINTGDDGTYAFTDVVPGAYTVRETDPDGFGSTTLNSVLVNLISGGTASASFGDIQAGTISGAVFNDINGNGIQDPGENGVGGVSVDLVDADGDVVDTAVTAGDGSYVFPGVLPGDYTVQENDPDGFDSATGNTRPVTVPSGGSAVANFGDGQAGTISGAVFNDANGSGVQDAGETGIAGVTVTLVDGDGVEVGIALTSVDGFFAFTEILPGSYTVSETDPDGFTSTTLNAVPVNLISGGTAAVGFGDIPTGTISGTVFNDLNGNGVQDPGEPGIGGVTVEILDENGGAVAAIVTAEDGSYAVSDLSPGSYLVRETDPPGFASTTINTVQVNMAPGGAAAVSFGDGQHGAVSGTVFNDGNGNGRQEPGETGLSGVPVELIDANGVTVQETTTTAAGVFAFTDVAPGAYTVVETDPDGFVSTSPNAVPINLAPNGAATAGFGDVQTGSVSGVVFNDLNGDGVQNPGETGLGGVTVELSDGDGNVVFAAVTANDGSYMFTGVATGDYTVREETPTGFQSTTGNSLPVSVAPGEPAIANFGDGQSGVIGGAVFNDLDGDGVRDAGENGIGGVGVALISADGTLVEEATTTANGSYAFTGIQPGDYTVRETDPDGFASTTDNDVAVSLPPNGAASANFGDIGVGTVSGVVFNDADGDGIQGPGESGVGGATVQLTGADGQPAGTAVTAGDGSYLFPQVPAGTYAMTETVPGGYQPTTPSSVEVQLDPGEGAAVNFGIRPETEEVLLPDLSNTTKMVVDINGPALMPGDALWYGVAIYNAGEGAALDVVYTDDLPADAALVQREGRDFVETSQGFVISGNAPGDARIEVDLGVIPASERAVITYYVQIDDDASAGTWLANQGAVDYEDIVGGAYHEPTDFPDTTALNDPTVIGPVADVFDDANLTAEKSAEPSGPDVQPGETIEYTVRVTNNGPGTARNVAFTDSAPLYTTFVAGSLTTDMGVIDDGPPLRVIVDSLEAGTTATVRFQVVVDGDAPPNAVLVNQGAVTRSGGIGPALTTPVETVVAGGAPEVEVYKTVVDVNGVSVYPEDALEYTLTIVNTGSSAATDVSVTDDLAAQSDVIAIVPDSAYFDGAAGPAWTIGSNAERVDALLDVLEPGASATIRFRAVVAADTADGTRIPNQAVVSWSQDGATHQEVSDDAVTLAEDDPTVVVVVYDPGAYDPPRATKTVEGNRPVVRWTMTWINDRNDDALLVRVEDDVPEGLTYIENSVAAEFADPGFPRHENGVIVWEGSIPAGGSVDIWYDTNVPEEIDRVENQARGFWDENADGNLDDEELSNPSPVTTNDPFTAPAGDPTVWSDAACLFAIEGFVRLDPCAECPCDVPDPSPKPGAPIFVASEIEERVTGQNGVRVELYMDLDGNGVYSAGDLFLRAVDTATRADGDCEDCAGHYAFGDLCAGDYVVRIAPANFNAGGVFQGYESAAGTREAFLRLSAATPGQTVGPFIFQETGAEGLEPGRVGDDGGGGGGGGCIIAAAADGFHPWKAVWLMILPVLATAGALARRSRRNRR